MDYPHFAVVAIALVAKLTAFMVSLMKGSPPPPKYQLKLDHRHKKKPRPKSSAEPKSSDEPTHPLLKFPNDIKICIFDHLDPIDSTSFGLSSQYIYPVYHDLFPESLPLYQPGAGQLALPWKDRVPERESKPRIPICWKCGPNRCELHRHIQDFVGRDALEKQSPWLQKKALQEFGPCFQGHLFRPAFCAMKEMGFDPSTKSPCGCWHHRDTED